MVAAEPSSRSSGRDYSRPSAESGRHLPSESSELEAARASGVPLGPYSPIQVCTWRVYQLLIDYCMKSSSL